MRSSQFMLATLKETPADAQLISHQLMLRAGMIRKLASGLYNWLPLGFRVLENVKRIVQEEMRAAGALELLLTAVQPAELWHETNRWENFGPELLKIYDRHKREFCFGPTHEEVITQIIKHDVRSYKQLPLNLFQIQTKFRDEIRPRFGVMRSREFLMKDAYSFHLGEESLADTYQVMFDAYCRIFDRIGLDYRPVLADTGSIGGKVSHEFQVLADSGEDEIFYSDGSDYAANVELASAFPDEDDPENSQAHEKIHTPGKTSIADVCVLLNITPNRTVKTLIVKGANDDLVALLIRGDHELNPLKAEKHPLVAVPFEFATDADIKAATGCTPGSLGPFNINMTIIADNSVLALSGFVCGATEEEYHYQHVNWGRDLPRPEHADLRNVVVGDKSPDGKGLLQSRRGIEVGHIFQLGDKYSRAMDATVLDENGKTQHMMMGCYGIGISRIVAAVIEQHHDYNGIIWPQSIAPFQLVLIGINLKKSDAVRSACEEFYRTLSDAGIDVLFDDRHERPGVLFADNDLIGIPHRLVVSDRGLEAGTFEYKTRTADESENIARDAVIEFLQSKLG